jgi:hypothetical protein
LEDGKRMLSCDTLECITFEWCRLYINFKAYSKCDIGVRIACQSS